VHVTETQLARELGAATALVSEGASELLLGKRLALGLALLLAQPLVLQREQGLAPTWSEAALACLWAQLWAGWLVSELGLQKDKVLGQPLAQVLVMELASGKARALVLKSDHELVPLWVAGWVDTLELALGKTMGSALAPKLSVLVWVLGWEPSMGSQWGRRWVSTKAPEWACVLECERVREWESVSVCSLEKTKALTTELELEPPWG
jgi:hypothetical protein